MILDFRGPAWFFGTDIAIQVLGLVISLIIAYYGYKLYKITSKKLDLYFSIAFFLLGLEFIIYILVIPAVFIYYNYFPTLQPGILLTIARSLNFIYMFAISLAYIFLILVYSGIEKKNVIALISSLILALTLYSYITRSYFCFNLTSTLLTGFIVFHAYRNYLAKKTKNAFLVLLTFVLLTFSHFILAYAFYTNIQLAFLPGHISQFLGFASLLIMLIRVKYGRKKK